LRSDLKKEPGTPTVFRVEVYSSWEDYSMFVGVLIPSTLVTA
jgi:hypothetical protein